jgi:hypothetical protein
MLKKLLSFLSLSLISLSSYSYMELNFGVGTVEYDTPLLQGDSAVGYVNFQGYTDSNVTYGVSYNLETTDLYIGASIFDFDIDTLSASVGYAFGDLSEGAFRIGGSISSISYTANGYDVSSLFDTSAYFFSAGYSRMSEEGINYNVGVSVNLDDCDDNCETVAGYVGFPIGASNWNFNLSAAFADGQSYFGIGPTVKF